MSEETLRPILAVKKGALSGADKAKLTKAGYVVVESSIDDPLKAISGVAIPVDTLGVIHAAFKSLSGNEWARNAFGKHMVEAMLKEFNKP